MATHVHEDVHTHSAEGNHTGVLMAIIVFAILLFLFFYFGLPAMSRISNSSQPQINVPDKVDVNLQQK